MLRTGLGLGVAAVLLAAAGCRMCCHPYDYCGPVYQGGDCQSCSRGDRAGSVLAGTPDTWASPTVTPRPARSQAVVSTPRRVQTSGQTASPRRVRTSGQSASFATVGGRVQGRVEGEVRTGDVPGSERIVSVTDRAVDGSESSADQPEFASQPATESVSSLPASGWTARRESYNVSR
jgi:hypothetical protein